MKPYKYKSHRPTVDGQFMSYDLLTISCKHANNSYWHGFMHQTSSELVYRTSKGTPNSEFHDALESSVLCTKFLPKVSGQHDPSILTPIAASV